MQILRATDVHFYHTSLNVCISSALEILGFCYSYTKICMRSTVCTTWHPAVYIVSSGC